MRLAGNVVVWVKGAIDLIDANPYSAPTSIAETTDVVSRRWSSLRGVRSLFYFHLAVVCWSAATSLTDARQIEPPEVLIALFFFHPLQVHLFLSLLVCPMMMAIAVRRIEGRTKWFRVGIVVCSLFLSGFQFWVMLPLMQ